jgi:hypothetical protein
MWRESTEQRMIIVSQRQTELKAEASAIRSARKSTRRHSRFSGVRMQVGSALIAAGRTLAEEKSTPKPIRS